MMRPRRSTLLSLIPFFGWACSHSESPSDHLGSGAGAADQTSGDVDHTGGTSTGQPSGGGTATEGNTGGGIFGSGGFVNAGGSGSALGSGGEPDEDTNTGGNATSKQLPFLIGADITHTMEDEYWGATYTDGGQKKALETILKEHGFNAIRVDTFVDPSASGGYAEGKEQPFRNLEQTITLAKRVKAQGMYFLLDLHMSDTWTNPSAQGMPAAWVGQDLAALQNSVHDYVKDIVTQLIAAGARPDLVQVGNEITNGFLWDSGRASGSNFSNFASLLKSGISAVKDVDDDILVMLHIEKCNNLQTTRWWLDGVLDAGVKFDIFGQSCYAPAVVNGQQVHPGYQGEPQDWAPVFDALVAEYPELRFAIAEYSAEPKAAADLMFGLPDKRGVGTFNWDPTRSYETHPNVPLFDTGSAWNDFVVNDDRMAVFDQMAAAFAAAGR